MVKAVVTGMLIIFFGSLIALIASLQIFNFPEWAWSGEWPAGKMEEWGYGTGWVMLMWLGLFIQVIGGLILLPPSIKKRPHDLWGFMIFFGLFSLVSFSGEFFSARKGIRYGDNVLNSALYLLPFCAPAFICFLGGIRMRSSQPD